MLADRVRMGASNKRGGKFGEPYLYNEGMFEEQWEVGLSIRGGVVSKQSDHLLVETYPEGMHDEPSATFSTVNKIDLTNIDAITMLCEKTQNNYSTILAIQNDKTSHNTILRVVAPINPYTPSTNTVTLDVSSLVGEYYVTVGMMHSDPFSNHYAKIYEVVLE